MRAFLVAMILLMCTPCAACSRRPAPGAASEREPSKHVTADAAHEERAVVAVDLRARHQIIDGFGTTASPQGSEPWYQHLFYDDLRASILRVDLTPNFKTPYADNAYNSPWFHNQPALPGPDGNNVRAYRNAADYARPWSRQRAKIAVMGPQIERNLEYFDYDGATTRAAGELAALGELRRGKLGDFKLIGSVWSPAPWLKHSSGSQFAGHTGIMPHDRTPFPFIWGGNFAGGQLDTSDAPIEQFDDRALGGQGGTSALTQFARGLSAYVLGFQRKFQVHFYGISIQNELNFETFYNSCSYPQSGQYLIALKAVRRAFDAQPELRDIRIMGPEDLLGADHYALWQYGTGPDAVHKNLQYLEALRRDGEARRALALFAIHGYAADGVTGAGQDPWSWRAWAEGWKHSPAPGLPEVVSGFRALEKPSWMTETSGEGMQWAPAQGTPLEHTALGIGLKIHQALTSGYESAWLYWKLADPSLPETECLTDATLQTRSPKYVAAKHYFRFIRPGARRVGVVVRGKEGVYASAFLHSETATLTLVLLNVTDVPRAVALTGFQATGVTTEAFVSTSSALFQPLPNFPERELVLPPYSLVTVARTRMASAEMLGAPERP